MTTIVSERTIDSLFAFEFLCAAPTAVLVSPANNRGKGTPDHEVRTARRKLVFENKTLYQSRAKTGSWVVRIPIRQLSAYKRDAPRTIYLLPAKPTDVQRPWNRPCACDARMCVACHNPGRAGGPLHTRRWAGQTPPVRGAGPALRLQPGFCHWAGCITAPDLLDHIIRSGSPQYGKKDPWAELRAPDAAMATIPGATRFCHLLSAIARDVAEAAGTGLPADQPDALEPEDGMRLLDRSLVQGPMANVSLPDSTRRVVVGY